MIKKWFHTLFVAPTDNWLLQLFRYGFVGGTAFLVDYGTLFALTHFAGVSYLWSAAIAFVLGLITNYIISISWVFRHNDKMHIWQEFAFFTIVGIIGLLLNELIMFVGTDLIQFHYMISKLISTGIVFFWNFFARKYLVFAK